ncbi:T9SS type A sorting domain-containing protein [Flavobacterium sp. CAU 1735]|uniref:T9SS type A sorting domain-containing protein n=1 Tax=Flavobacterium sp. CAU 1735 TaxID=3140361 RepID=UPI0032605C3F
MKKIRCRLLFCCILFATALLEAQEEEVLVSTFLRFPAAKPDRLVDNISTVTNTEKKILADNFNLENKSKITRFNFVGQIGKTAPGDMSLIKGGHVFVIKRDLHWDMFKIPFSGTSLAHFYLDNTNPGLLKRIEDEKIIISVDLNLAEKELILESGGYWLAFAPVVATDGLSEDKVWYWYDGDGSGFDTLVWQNGDTEWHFGDVSATAYSIEGKKVTLGILKSDIETVTAKVCPNPSYDVFKISTPKEIVSVAVYNGNGQLVLQNRSETVDLSASPKGVYLLTVTCNDGTQVFEKLIKV